LSSCDTLLKRLAQDLEDVAAARRPCIQEEHAMVGQRHLARHRLIAPTDQTHIREGVMGGAKRPGRDQRGAVAGEAGNVWIHVVSMVSARVIAGRMVVRRRTSLDVPVPGGPSSSRLWSERLHDLQLHHRVLGKIMTAVRVALWLPAGQQCQSPR
jgi:hypothetical protein